MSEHDRIGRMSAAIALALALGFALLAPASRAQGLGMPALDATRYSDAEIAAYDARCGAGDADQCLEEGKAQHEMGKWSAALAAYDKACRMGKAGGCTGAGNILDYGGGGVWRNNRRAAGYYEQACAMDSATGCYLAGNSYRYGISPAEAESPAKDVRDER